MERWVAKVIAMVVSFLLPLICTLITYPLSGYIEKKGAMGKLILCRLMCFGGGIFFGTFLLHMAPETRAIMDEYLLIPNGIAYPLTDLIIGCGFFFVLFLEKAVMRINKRKNQAHQRRREEKCEWFKQMNQGHVCKSCSSGKPCEGLDGISTDFNTDSSNVTSRISMQVSDIEDIAMKSSNLSGDCPLSSSGNCCRDSLSITTSDAIVVDTKQSSLSKSTSSSSSLSSSDDHDHEVDGHHNMRSLILIMALSLHHLFEGLSLGLQHTVSRVFTLLLALMCHETIISFSLGLQFVKCNYTLKRFLITTVAVAIIMPIGVGIGTIMTEVGADSDAIEIANGIMQAFACGTFIFVTFFEILQEEIDPHDTSIGKVACVACGFFAMALLQLLPEEPSDENGIQETSEIFSNFTTLALTTANGFTKA